MGIRWISFEDVEELTNPNNIDTENIFATELDSESNYIVLKFEKDIDGYKLNRYLDYRQKLEEEQMERNGARE